MGFRFQKRIKIVPGLTLNLSKKGVSTSIGVRGARVTFGHNQTRTTVGVPGTGLSHTSIKSANSSSQQQPKANLSVGVIVFVAFAVIAIVLISSIK